MHDLKLIKNKKKIKKKEERERKGNKVNILVTQKITTFVFKKIFIQLEKYIIIMH